MGGSVLFIETLFDTLTDETQLNVSNTDDGTDFNNEDPTTKNLDQTHKKTPKISGLKVTGNLGKTMLESCEIA